MNLELSLNIRNGFFLINSKCRFSHRPCVWPGGGCCRCVSCWLALSFILVTIEITDEMVAGECVRGHRGMGPFPVSACVWCLQLAFDKQGSK